MKWGIVAVTGLCLAGCASRPDTAPYVAPEMAQFDAPALAKGVADFVVLDLHGKGRIWLTGPGGDTVFTPMVKDALTERGFEVVSDDRRHAHSVSFKVQPYDETHTVVSVYVDKKSASRMYRRNESTTTLMPEGPYLVMEGDAS